jgi:hypothetical protein
LHPPPPDLLSQIKELSVISSASDHLAWISLTDPSLTPHETTGGAAATPTTDSPTSSSQQSSPGLVTETTEQLKRVTMGTIAREQAGDSPRRHQTPTGNGSTRPLSATASGRGSTSQTETRSPSSAKGGQGHMLLATPTSRKQFVFNPETPDLLHSEDLSPETIKDVFDPSGKFEDRSTGFPNRSRIATPKVTPHRVSAELTGRFSSNIINPVVKGVPTSCLCLSHSVSLQSPTPLSESLASKGCWDIKEDQLPLFTMERCSLCPVVL